MSARARLLVALVAMTVLATVTPPVLAPAAAAAVPDRTPAETTAEARIVGAHAQARADRDRPPMHVRGDLRDAARGWSDQMARTRSFGHNPSLSRQICCWSQWGENVAWAGPVDAMGGPQAAADRIMQGWLASAGHRANLLDASFVEFGIGVSIARDGRMYVTAVFRAPDGRIPPARLPEPVPRAIDTACPSAMVPASPFTDVGPTHARAVSCLAWWDVAAGTTATTFAPTETVTRGQLASFVARSIEFSGGSLPDGSTQRFSDVPDHHAHAGSIRALAAASVIGGYGDGSFRPNEPVTRAQMARMLVQGHERRTAARLPAPRRDWFFDDHGASERVVNQAVEAGWAAGTGDGRFQPGASLQRGHLALFVTRWLDTLAADHGAPLPD